MAFRFEQRSDVDAQALARVQKVLEGTHKRRRSRASVSDVDNTARTRIPDARGYRVARKQTYGGREWALPAQWLFKGWQDDTAVAAQFAVFICQNPDRFSALGGAEQLARLVALTPTHRRMIAEQEALDLFSDVREAA